MHFYKTWNCRYCSNCIMAAAMRYWSLHHSHFKHVTILLWEVALLQSKYVFWLPYQKKYLLLTQCKICTVSYRPEFWVHLVPSKVWIIEEDFVAECRTRLNQIRNNEDAFDRKWRARPEESWGRKLKLKSNVAKNVWITLSENKMNRQKSRYGAA